MLEGRRLPTKGQAVKRKNTPIEDLGNGRTRVTVKRICNGCGRSLGDALDSELDAAINHQPMPDVRDECTCLQVDDSTRSHIIDSEISRAGKGKTICGLPVPSVEATFIAPRLDVASCPRCLPPELRDRFTVSATFKDVDPALHDLLTNAWGDETHDTTDRFDGVRCRATHKDFGRCTREVHSTGDHRPAR